MTWTMPPRVLQVVAAAIALIAIGSFIMGSVNAPQRGRLPGERGSVTGAAPILATDAMPLGDERIEGAPPPVELTPEEKAKLEADKKAKADAEAAKVDAEATVAGAPAKPAATPAAPAAGDKVGDLLDSVTPPPSEDPPH